MTKHKKEDRDDCNMLAMYRDVMMIGLSNGRSHGCKLCNHKEEQETKALIIEEDCNLKMTPLCRLDWPILLRPSTGWWTRIFVPIAILRNFLWRHFGVFKISKGAWEASWHNVPRAASTLALHQCQEKWILPWRDSLLLTRDFQRRGKDGPWQGQGSPRMGPVVHGTRSTQFSRALLVLS